MADYTQVSMRFMAYVIARGRPIYNEVKCLGKRKKGQCAGIEPGTKLGSARHVTVTIPYIQPKVYDLRIIYTT